MAEKTVAVAEDQAEVIPSTETTRTQERFVAPPVDIYETSDGLAMLVDLPGVNMAGIDVQVKDDILSIRARANDNSPGRLIHREYQLSSFFREFQLSDAVDVQRIGAELRHGVLKLTLPKAEAAKPKHIQVQVS